MSIALQSNGGDTIRRPRFIHGGMPCISIYDSSSDPKVFAAGRDHRCLEQDLDSCSSSSIGRNSDVSDGSSSAEDSAHDEVQSSFKGPLDTMDELQEVLPIKRGISKFYSGKSKSFTSLADASSASSIKDFSKPENPYNRKRKNLLVRSNAWDKNCSYPLKNIGVGTSKKPANSNRSTFLLVGETSNSFGSNSSREDFSSVSTSPSCSLPPLHPHGKRSPTNGSSSPPQRHSPWRSFSLSDLQSVDSSTPNITGLAISRGEN